MGENIRKGSNLKKEIAVTLYCIIAYLLLSVSKIIPPSFLSQFYAGLCQKKKDDKI